MTTNKQKEAVRFCERWVDTEFKGDINNYNEVSSFLSEHLERAKIVAEECSFYINADIY